MRYAVFPPGAFHTLVVQVARMFPHSLEFGSSYAIALLDSGHLVQIFCLRVPKAQRGIVACFGTLLKHSAVASRTVDAEEHMDTGPVLPDWDRDGASARTNGSVVGSVQ